MLYDLLIRYLIPGLSNVYIRKAYEGLRILTPRVGYICMYIRYFCYYEQYSPGKVDKLRSRLGIFKLCFGISENDLWTETIKFQFTELC